MTYIVLKALLNSNQHVGYDSLPQPNQVFFGLLVSLTHSTSCL